MQNLYFVYIPSFQRYHKLPVTKKDIKLDLVLTEKELIE